MSIHAQPSGSCMALSSSSWLCRKVSTNSSLKVSWRWASILENTDLDHRNTCRHLMRGSWSLWLVDWARLTCRTGRRTPGWNIALLKHLRWAATWNFANFKECYNLRCSGCLVLEHCWILQRGDESEALAICHRQQQSPTSGFQSTPGLSILLLRRRQLKITFCHRAPLELLDRGFSHFTLLTLTLAIFLRPTLASIGA